MTFFDATSMIDTPPSREWAVQSSRPSGDRSRPSGPLPTGITVCVQAAAGALLDDRHAVRPDVRGEDRPRVLGRQHHVRAVLPGLELPVDLVGRRIVARDLLVGLGREVQLAVRRTPARAAATAARRRCGAAPFRRRCRSSRSCGPARGRCRSCSQTPSCRRPTSTSSCGPCPVGDRAEHRAGLGIDDDQRRVFLVQDEQPRAARLRRRPRPQPRRPRRGSG